MKKLIVLIVALLGCTGIAFAFKPSITYVVNEGNVVESGQNISANLAQAESDSVKLHKMEADTMIYSSLLKSYDYNTKTAIDLSYPMYVNNGTTLNFLNGKYTLVSDEFQLLDTYNGLYLANGNTYNEDLSQADGDDFFFVALENGLYMNAQTATFKNSLTEIQIPVNSIVKFQETDVRFYQYSNGELLFTSINEVYGATITIGEDTFNYADFLEAMGLLSEVVERKDDGKDTQDIIEEIKELLDIEDKDSNTIRNESIANSTEDSDTKDEENESKVEEDDAEVVPDDEDVEGDNKAEEIKPDKEEQEEGHKDPEEPDKEEGEEDTETDPNPDGNEGSGVVGEGSGEIIEPEYQEPKVFLSGLDTWAYAVHGDLNIVDYSATIRRGVAITVYGKITGAGGTIVNEDGVEVFSSKKYVGSSAKMRKTYYSGQEFTLNGLKPDTDLYVQYTYSYTMEMTNEETGEETYTTRYVTSDLYPITTQTIEESDLPTVNMTFEPQFALKSDRMTLEKLHVENDSDYVIPEPGYMGVDFDNFKLNVLPYISKLIFDFEDGSKIELTSGTVVKAIAEEGTVYTSGASSLTSNKEHKYTVSAVDKYGNKLDLNVNNSDNCQGSVYTAKTKPTVTIEEIENVTDQLTIGITINDPDGAIETANGRATDLNLFVTNTAGELAALTGTWKDGSEFSSETGTGEVRLKNPSHGKTYELALDTLAFARTYNFQVYGNYVPQPDVKTSNTVPQQNEILFGGSKIYTAAITSGLIEIETENIDVRDTGADIGFTLGEESTLEVLYLIDELRIGVKQTDEDKEKATVVLKESELSKIQLGDVGYEYNAEEKSVVIMNEPNSNVKVELVGEREAFENPGVHSLWDAIMLKEYTITDDQGKETTERSTPVQVKVTVEDGSLATSTVHTMTYEAVVIKSGIEYSIPVVLSNSKLQTKKLNPIITMDDSLAVNDNIQLINFDITDIDQTITGKGVAELRLYKGDAILQKQTISVADDPDTVVFNRLISGIEYTIEVVALAYNNDIGYASYQPEYLMKTYTIEAGSDIKAEVNLNYLEYKYSNRTEEPVLAMSGSECQEQIDEENWDYLTHGGGIHYNGIATTFIDVANIASKYDVLELEYTPGTNTTDDPTMYGVNYMFFYNSSKIEIGRAATAYSSGGIITGVIPEGTQYIRMYFGDLETLTTWGFKLYGYQFNAGDEEPVVTLIKKDSDESHAVVKGVKGNKDGTILPSTSTSSTGADIKTKNSSYRTVYQLPVQPGEIYSAQGASTGGYIYLYNEDRGYVGYEVALTCGSMFVVPENIYYISFAVSYDTYTMNYNTEFNLYRVASAYDSSIGGAKYEMSADISVYDKNSYLLDKNGKSTVKLTLERSETISDASNTDYTEIVTYDIEMLEKEDGYYGFKELLEKLDPNTSYRISVTGEYQGEEIILTQEIFETDAAYIIINDSEEFHQVYRYPYANFLVMNDITITTRSKTNFYGTVDFNGHTVTRTKNEYIFTSLGTSGVLKNMVLEQENPDINGLTNVNYGTIENIIIRTAGNMRFGAVARGLIANINNGTIRNFVIELGGDVTYQHYQQGLVAGRIDAGTIEDGYIYGTNNATLIFEEGSRESAGAVGYIFANATLRNIYGAYDVYVEDWENRYTMNNGYALYATNFSNEVYGMYHIGDFYQYEDYQKTDVVLEKHSVAKNLHNAYQVEDIWALSSNTYQQSGANENTKTATVSMLRDTTWQKSVLGNGFDIDASVIMGYYPRLKLPTCMEQHQAYRRLPIENQEFIPQIVEDRFTEGYEVHNDSAYITLRMENPQDYTITDVVLKSLKVTAIIEQGKAKDGLYDVVLSVSVAQDTGEEAYLSAYEVESFDYNNNGIGKEVVSEYITHNIAFYKEISSVADWISINDNMDWNYRLTKDIEFKGNESYGAVIINGSRASTGSTTFTGSIDGAEHSITGIRFVDVDRPYVIYTLGAKASIKNLYINDLYLDGKYVLATEVSGFIRYMISSSIVENVHMSRVTIKSSGYVGALVGRVSVGQLRNCSVNHATIIQESARYNTCMGGLVGYAYENNIANCYVNDLDIEAYDTSTVTGIGGMVGHLNQCGIYNSYVQGEINSDGSSIGGVIGNSDVWACTVENVYSDVDIVTIGSKVGGAFGTNPQFGFSNLVMGDIIAGNTSVSRICGLKTENTQIFRENYAYEGQVVNDMTSEDLGDATRLFEPQELAQKQYWLDDMSFSTQWDYSVLGQNKLPILYYQDTTIPLPNQELRNIPGQEAVSVAIEKATTQSSVGSAKRYIVDVSITDVNKSYNELKEAVDNGEILFYIDGMNMDAVNRVDSDAELEQGKWTYQCENKTGHPNTLRILITTTGVEKYLSTYRMMVTDKRGGGETTHISVINYGEQLYYTISNIQDWEEFINEKDVDTNEYVHAKSSENIRITGDIDFDDATKPLVSGLVLGKIEGIKIGDDVLGEKRNVQIKNIKFATTTEKGGVWINSCESISNIDFVDNIVTVKSVPAYQTMATLIGTVNGDFTDVGIDKLTVDTEYSYGGALGLCYMINGDVSQVNVSNVKLESKASTYKYSYRSYAGSIAAYLTGTYTDIRAEDITIDCLSVNQVGGLFGYARGYTADGSSVPSENIELENIIIHAYGLAGGMIGNTGNIYVMKDVTAEKIEVESFGSAGGLIGNANFTSPSGESNNNITVKDSSVRSNDPDTNATAYTGGLFGRNYQWLKSYNITVEDVDVQGYFRVGGIAGEDYSYERYGVNVLGCTITQYNSKNINETAGVGAVGGRQTISTATSKNVVIRDTTISGDSNVGGHTGSVPSMYKLITANIYIAEDVTVTASYGRVGGIVGQAEKFYFTDVAMGAEIVSRTDYAGGLIGYVAGESTDQKIYGAYVMGSVTGLDYVGGIIGYTEDEIRWDANKLNGVIVGADLNAQGDIGLVGTYEDESSYISGYIAVWEEMLMNGQTVATLYAAKDEKDKPLLTLPSGVEVVEAEWFKQGNNYKEYHFNDINTSNLSVDGNSYMPYIASDTTDTTNTTGEALKYAKNYKDESVGILLPTKVNVGATVVYTSGVNTLNIETTQPQVTIVLGSGSNAKTVYYTFEADDKKGETYNVLTIQYDFQSDITVDGMTYVSSEFTNTVMTWDGQWHYIGEVASGSTTMYYGGDGTREPVSHSVADELIHLWQGYALAKDGSVYKYDSVWKEVAVDSEQGTDSDETGKYVSGAYLGDGTDVSGNAETGIYVYNESAALYDYGNIDVYYNFTIEDDSITGIMKYYGYRILIGDGYRYNVFVTQDMMYDAYVLANKKEGRYFALVNNSGTMVNYLTAINAPNEFRATDIQEMSNSYGYGASCLITKYEDGTIQVLNYITGELLYEQRPASTRGFMSFARACVNGLANSMFGSHITMDDSYAANENLMSIYLDEEGVISQSSNKVLVTGNQAMASANQALAEDGNAPEGQESSGELSTDVNTENTEQKDSNHEEIREDATDNHLMKDDADKNDMQHNNATQKEETDGVITNGTNTISETTPYSNSTTQSEKLEEESSREGSNKDRGVSEGTEQSSASGEQSDMEAGVAHENMMIAEATDSYTIAYNPYTEQYETYETSDITATGNVVGESQNLVMKTTIEEAQEESKADSNQFTINTITSNVWSSDEKHGFIFLGIIGVMGVLVVITMNVKMRKRRK